MTLSDKKQYYIKKATPNYYYEEEDVKQFIEDIKDMHIVKFPPKVCETCKKIERFFVVSSLTLDESCIKRCVKCEIDKQAGPKLS